MYDTWKLIRLTRSQLRIPKQLNKFWAYFYVQSLCHDNLFLSIFQFQHNEFLKFLVGQSINYILIYRQALPTVQSHCRGGYFLLSSGRYSSIFHIFLANFIISSTLKYFIIGTWQTLALLPLRCFYIFIRFNSLPSFLRLLSA